MKRNSFGLIALLLLFVSTNLFAQHAISLDDGSGHYSLLKGQTNDPFDIFYLPSGGGTLLTIPTQGNPALMWLTAGNGSLTDLTNNFLGTIDNTPLRIVTGAADSPHTRIFIDVDGTTNINTTTHALTTIGDGSANTQLTINGSADAFSGDSYSPFNLAEWDLNVQGDMAVTGIARFGNSGQGGSIWIDGSSSPNTINSDNWLYLNSGFGPISLNDANGNATNLNTNGGGLVTIGNLSVGSTALNSVTISAPNIPSTASIANILVLNGGNINTSSLNVVTGSGTLNYIPKWTPDGNTLGNSILFDDGSSHVGVNTNTPSHLFEINGTVDALSTDGIASTNWDLAVYGDIAATGIIKSGAGVTIDGVSNPHQVSADQPLKVTSSSTDLTMEETGDFFGTSQLIMQDRIGSNGALFTQTPNGANFGTDLVDFGFKPGAGVQSNIRLEARSAQGINPANFGNGEFQFIDNSTDAYQFTFAAGRASAYFGEPLSIGVNVPTATLDVNGNARIRTLTGEGSNIVTTDVDGFLGNTTASSLSLVSGSGTLNYIPKWTPDGNTLGNSILFDDGLSHVGVNTITPSHLFEINGTVDAVSTDAIASTNWDLAVYGDIAASGIIKSGAGVTIDGVSNPHQVSADQPLKVTSSSTDLTMEETGDFYGTSQIVVQDRDWTNGAVIVQTPTTAGIDLADLGFKPGAVAQSNIRLEGRNAALFNPANSNGEFQFIDNATLAGPNKSTFTIGNTSAYFNVNVGIGVAVPAALFSVGTGSALQVDNSGNLTTSGNLSTTGTGAITSANGLTVSAGLTTLSYTTVAAGAAIAIPATSTVIEITDDNGGVANASANVITMPAVVAADNGRIIYIHNGDADPTTGVGPIIAAGNTATFVVSGAAWQRVGP